VLAVPAEKVRQVVTEDPALGDLILRAFILRRSLLIELGVGVQTVGSGHSPDSRRLRDFLALIRIPHSWLDVEDDERAAELLQAGTASRIENYLGFPSRISGGELAARAVIQAEKFGTRIVVPADAAALGEEDAYVVEFAEGARIVEFLGGAERYKLALADRLEPLYEAIGLAPTLRGRLAVAAVVNGIRLRRRAKRSEALRRFYYEGLSPARVAAGRVVRRGRSER